MCARTQPHTYTLLVCLCEMLLVSSDVGLCKVNPSIHSIGLFAIFNEQQTLTLPSSQIGTGGTSASDWLRDLCNLSNSI